MTSRAWITSTSAKALVAVLFAALFFLGLQAPAAHATGDVDLTVNVKTKSGSAISGLEVIAYEVQNHHSDFSQFVTGVALSTSGSYRLDNLDLNQDYALYFYVNNKSTAFDQFYGGTTWVEEATLVRWSSAGARDLSITLATNTSIIGKVSISSTTGLAKVRVIAYRFDGTGWFDVAEVLTGSTGNYALRNLEPGSYKLKFEPDNLKGYAPRYSGNGTSLQTATSVYSGLGSSTTLNMRLVTGAKISGTVGLYPFTYNASGIVPVAYRMLGDAINGYTGIDKSEFYLGPKVASGCTGTVVYCKWTVPGLPAGAYAVKLYDFSGLLPYYEPMWVDYGDGTDLASTARIFTVSGSSTVTATPSTVLKTAGDIAVTSLDITVENPSGDPVEDADVVLESEGNNDAVRTVSTDAAGVAHFDRIGEGDFIADITTDDATTHYQPDLNSFTISGTGTHSLTFGLATLTAFSFTAPATVSWSNTTVGSQFTAVVPKTTMDNGSGAEQDVDYDYQWYRGATAIFGANDDQYVTKSGDVGSTVSVVVSASTFGYSDISEIAQAGAVTTPGTPAHVTTLPSITSPTAAKPGVVLSANPGSWDASGVRFAYTWKRDGSPIATNGTSRTYTLTPSDANHNVTVSVIATKPGLQDSAAATSAPVAVGLLAAPTSTKGSSITASTSGLPAGQTRYTLSMGSWTVPGGTWHVDWFVDGDPVVASPPISGTNTQTFLFDPGTHPGALVQATVVVDKLGYATGSRSYLVRRGGVPAVADPGGVTPPWSSTPYTDTDNVDWGIQLQATPPQLTYPNLTGNTIKVSYQWQRKSGTTWGDISGAKWSGYQTVSGDSGHAIRVRVTTTSSQYATYTTYLSGGNAVPKWDLIGSGTQPTIEIVGSGDVGTTKLAQVVGSWAVSGVTQSYKWYTCDQTAFPTQCDNNLLDPAWVVVGGATSASWTPSTAMVNHRVTVVVTASKSGYASMSHESDGEFLLDANSTQDAITFLKSPAIASGLVSGKAVIGRTLTGAMGTVDTSSVVHSYQWQVSNDGTMWSAISGATSLTYAPPGDLWAAHPAGKIRLRDIASKAGLPSATDYSPMVTLQQGTNVPSVAPSVTGGAPYIVNPGTWPAGTTFAVEFRENGGSPTTDSVAPYSFTPVSSTSVVTAKVVPTRPGYTSDTIRLVARKGNATFTPSVLNGSTVGDTFSATGTGFAFGMGSPEASYAYQWYSNGSAISGAKSTTFVPSGSYLGKSLNLRITMTSPLYNTVVGSFPATVVAAHPAATGTPTLTSPSAAKPGVKVTVTPGVFSTTGLTFSYQIQRSTNGGGSWSTVSTSSSYTLGTSNAGNLFRAIVTAKKTGWTTAVITTASLPIGWLGPLATVGPLTIDGTGAVGSVLKVSPVWNTSSVTATYRWTRNGVTIPGVTGTSFPPLADSYGDEIDVIVTASKAGYQQVVISSNTVKVGEALAAAPTASTVPVISGATGGTNVPQVGDVLSSTTGVWNVDGLTFAYQWRAAGVSIGGATSPTYTVTGTEVGKVITVVVTATKTGWTNGTSTSKPTLATIA